MVDYFHEEDWKKGYARAAKKETKLAFLEKGGLSVPFEKRGRGRVSLFGKNGYRLL
jgi:hypothetical protein